MQILSENFNILVVEDNPSDLFLLEQMLLASRLKFKKIMSASRLAEAKDILKEQPIHLVLLDLSLPDSFGIESLKEISDVVQKIPVIILTGLADSDIALEALKQGAQDYLIKGEFNSNLLGKSIEYSIERKKVKENIHASEEKYRQMFYKNPFPMWVYDAETLHILEVNDAAIQKYGYQRSEFLRLSLNDLQQFCYLKECNVTGSAISEKTCKHQRKDGETMIVEFTSYPIDYFGRTAMQAQVNDITETVRLENELNSKKQQLVEAVLKAQETERKNIGGELHDNINQILTAVKLNLSLALEPGPQRDILISKCIGNTSTAIEEIRKLSKALILPGNLKELGISHSVEDMLNEVLPLSNIDWELDVDDIDHLVSEEQKLAIYRIIQEQLNNILKHAQATAVRIELTASEAKIILVVTDNGKGFDILQRRNGIGITNIISRAELFNGNVKINSSPGNGCTIEVVMDAKGPAPLSSVFLPDRISVN